jgi:hypothetical protein
MKITADYRVTVSITGDAELDRHFPDYDKGISDPANPFGSEDNHPFVQRGRALASQHCGVLADAFEFDDLDVDDDNNHIYIFVGEY